MGLRGTGSDTVVFDDVFVPDAAVSVVRPAGVWHPVWDTVLGVAMPTIMAAYLGIAEAAADQAFTFARHRAAEPHVQTQVGQLVNLLNQARDVVAAMVASVDDLQFTPSLAHTAEVLARKTVAADALIAVGAPGDGDLRRRRFRHRRDRAPLPRRPRRALPPAPRRPATPVHAAVSPSASTP